MKNLLIVRVPESWSHKQFDVTGKAINQLCNDMGNCASVLIPHSGNEILFSTLSPGFELTDSQRDKLKSLLENITLAEEKQEQPEIPIE